MAELTEIYKERFKKGTEFEDFVAKILLQELGIPLMNYSSEKNQYNAGENKQGIEIKYQQQMTNFKSIFIEVSEKRNKNNKNFIPSGIFREDKTWLWVTGDYNTLYFFSKKCLISLYKTGKYPIKENKEKTGKGFTLLKKDIEKYSIKKIIVEDLNDE